jgi:peptidoglycan/xylan/chitin deacetylase (PgdA/CDA1 family)
LRLSFLSNIRTMNPVKPKLALILLSVLFLFIYTGCINSSANMAIDAAAGNVLSPDPAPAVTPKTETLIIGNPAGDAASILAKEEVPILCYHQIRDYKSTDGPVGRPYIVPVSNFAHQMKTLADSGYHSVSPAQVHDYLINGKALPSKPVMITFDDTRLDQYTAALPELNKYGFKGVFFIMTVSLGRPGYMSKDQVKQLSDQGHTIGSHTWDHKNVKKYTEEDWTTQIIKPSKQLQSITGKPVEYFAYPFGLWNKEAITGLRKHSNFKAVFQLYAKRDDKDPLYTIRRIIVPGSWTGAGLLRTMNKNF